MKYLKLAKVAVIATGNRVLILTFIITEYFIKKIINYENRTDTTN